MTGTVDMLTKTGGWEKCDTQEWTDHKCTHQIDNICYVIWNF